MKSTAKINHNGAITFIGAGKMASAIAGAIINSGFDKDKIFAIDRSETQSAQFRKTTGIVPLIATEICDREKDIFEKTDIVFLSVKPQNMKEIGIYAPYIKNKLLISIAAGVKIKTLMQISSCERIIRIMPNTPALVKAAMSAFSISNNISAEDINTVENILATFGEYCMVEEKLMDAVTGLSGSGPAYVFDFIQALADGGVANGLPRATALKLAAQTVMGSAKMVLETGEHPSVLKDQVTSPAGTTVRGLSVLEKGSFRGLVSDAVTAASKRSEELGKEQG